ncbi:MAG: pilus assembly PilX family protein [Arenicellales bacterium]
MKRFKHPSCSHAQCGVALVISMILLVVISLLSISAMRATNIDSRIAANYQHKQLSFQVAESVFVKLTDRSPQIQRPTASSGTLKSVDYISYAATSGQPAASADLELRFIRESTAGEYKVSGYSLDVKTLIYQADAYGEVNGSHTRTHNRAMMVRVDNRN